jgi:hypothetical protein
VQYDGDEKYGCGGQYPFTIAARGMTIGIIARARRWSYCRSDRVKFGMVLPL